MHTAMILWHRITQAQNGQYQVVMSQYHVSKVQADDMKDIRRCCNILLTLPVLMFCFLPSLKQ